LPIVTSGPVARVERQQKAGAESPDCATGISCA
jgi:hypothetical protein